ncbi:MAG: divergent polysaccharide deacetylase family protein [Candidatus Cloacimonadaceae bacterium]|jgi:polysaccharide deacetylase 2 family uncharacterized protein YibQ|nr:divergent polysaccharide deacetylase family protein [Candidatus Cloacimonadota bacterium]MCB5258625.1 divergent polysaccharide deacetylase family protein [Candidatus Cloacimonadota bacterium]MDY0111402.1 divergent polysaccharide deacetylase family protein [Candidatus Syntrophosphaera sp.]
MTKQTKYPNRHKARKDNPVGLYLLILLLCGAIIFVIVYKGKEEGLPPEFQEPSIKKFNSSELLQSLEEKFELAEGSLQIKTIHHQKQLSIPVNPSKMDLTFANMIVKGEFEIRGGKLVSGFVEDDGQLLTFKVGPDTYKVKLYYKKPVSIIRKYPKYIAIVVDDFGGIGGDLLQSFLNLPLEIDFAILPGLSHSEEAMNKAFKQGRETLVHLPMEPLNYPSQNPGKDAILVQMDRSEVEKLVLKHLNSLPLCSGVNNHMGSLATTDKEIMSYVMEVLRKKDKFFLDSRTSAVSVAYQIAQKAQILAFRNDLFLDSPDISNATMESKIERIKQITNSRNYVIAITHCHSAEKLRYLQDFISRIQKEGFTLKRLSELKEQEVPAII